MAAAGAERGGVQPFARIRLFFASWVTSARPSASSSGGM
jgi:hypothetical protein